MGIIQFVEKVCVQTAVYWGSPVSDGLGGNTYATAVDIACRWDGHLENMLNKFGNQITSKAKILVTQDVDEDGFLYLGSLADLSTEEKLNPMKVEKAFPIQRVDKTPLFKSTNKFVRQVYL